MSSKHKGSPKLYKGMKSLNPAGRPKGSMNKFTALSRELMSIKGPEIVQKVVDLALEGDRTCLKMCMDRIIPTTKAIEFRSSEDRGNVIINVGGLTEKIIEEDKKKSLDYEEGIIISAKDEDEILVKLGTNG
jgi:predicted ThiF/HesA family dinucleotide-utilizing enzyme